MLSNAHRELKTFVLSYQFFKEKRLCPFFLILMRLLLPFLRYHIFSHILSLPRKSLLNVKQILCLLLLVWTFIVTFLLMLFYRRKKQEILHSDINLHDSIYIIILVMQLYVFNVQYFFCKYFLVFWLKCMLFMFLESNVCYVHISANVARVHFLLL